MDSNNIVNFQESSTILNAHTKKSLETFCMHLVCIYYPWYEVNVKKYTVGKYITKTGVLTESTLSDVLTIVDLPTSLHIFWPSLSNLAYL